jgi:muramoyltetrapeptide carboxypeptidase LdcA involved in peptidoglycan recycling
MYFPPIIKKGDTIGICAPSAGIGRDLDSYIRSIKKFEEAGFRIKETKSVRNNAEPSADGKTRGEEFNSLMKDKEVKMIIAAAGGSFNYEMMPYIDEKLIQENPKWVMGFSDPTFLTYYITCKFDIASYYGKNALFLDFPIKHRTTSDALALIQGEPVIQRSYEYFEKERDYESEGCNLDTPVYWELYHAKEINCKGRVIGGCVDVIANMIGTPYDATKDFINRYEDIIWYFDVFSYDAIELYLLMLQMKHCGYFRNTKAVIFGRVLLKGGSEDEAYVELLKKCFDIPFLMNVDIGHVRPTMTLINGAIIHLACADGKGEIAFEKM